VPVGKLENSFFLAGIWDNTFYLAKAHNKVTRGKKVEK
jgi:hypothetical protein